MKRYKQPEIFERIRPRAGAGKAKKQREDMRGSGVYPASGPWPKGKAAVRAPADWNKRSIAGAPKAKMKKPGGKTPANAKAKSMVEKGT